MQIALLGEGCRAEHAEVRLLPGVLHHVGLQHHLLVEGLAAVGALEGSLPCERQRERRRKRLREMKEEEGKTVEGWQQRATVIECYSDIVDASKFPVQMLNVNVTLLTV